MTSDDRHNGHNSPGTPSVRSATTAQRERQQLADLLLSLGPDKPTLCEGWNTRDLAVHLVLREYRPDATAGMFISSLSGHLDKKTAEYEKKPYAELVEAFRSGPPVWNPMRLGDKFINAAENFVHHEDARRGGGEYTPRDLPAEERDELWKVVGQVSRFFLRDSTVHVILERTDAASSSSSSSSSSSTPSASNPVHRAGANASAEVRVAGEAGELLLWLFGRDDAAQVEITESEPGAKDGVVKRVA